MHLSRQKELEKIFTFLSIAGIKRTFFDQCIGFDANAGKLIKRGVRESSERILEIVQ